MASRRYKDCPPFVGRLHGDALLAVYAEVRVVGELEQVTGVKKWQIFQWVKAARQPLQYSLIDGSHPPATFRSLRRRLAVTVGQRRYWIRSG